MNGPTLADLINRRGAVRPLIRAAKEKGHVSSESTWRQWANPELKPRKDIPSTDIIKAFAAGLGISETEVLLAAGRQVGLDVGPENTTDLILPGAGILGPGEKNMLATMAAFLVSKMGSDAR